MLNNWKIDLKAERDEYIKEEAEFEAGIYDDEYEDIEEVTSDPQNKEHEKEFKYDPDFEPYEGERLEEDSSTYAMLGDEISAGFIDDYTFSQFGIVVGVICDAKDRHVCYKVWTQDDGAADGFFDYIAAKDVVICEPSGDTVWSLGRIGYRLVEEENGFRYFVNDETGDAVVW